MYVCNNVKVRFLFEMQLVAEREGEKEMEKKYRGCSCQDGVAFATLLGGKDRVF